MTINFIVAQIIGVCALLMLIISLQHNTKIKLLKFQLLSSLLYATQYVLLGAYTGCFLNLTCALRNYVFSKYEDRKAPIIWLILIVLLLIVFSLITATDAISFLLTGGIILFTVAMWYGNLTYIRISEAIACSLLMIYNIKVLAFISCISTTIEICTVLIAIYRFDIKKVKA